MLLSSISHGVRTISYFPWKIFHTSCITLFWEKIIYLVLLYLQYQTVFICITLINYLCYNKIRVGTYPLPFLHLCLSESAALYWNHHPIWSKLFGEEESRLFFDLPNSGWDVNRDEPRFPFLKRWPHTTKYKLVIRVEHPGFLGNPFNFMAFSMKVLTSFFDSSKI